MFGWQENHYGIRREHFRRAERSAEREQRRVFERNRVRDGRFSIPAPVEPEPETPIASPPAPAPPSDLEARSITVTSETLHTVSGDGLVVAKPAHLRPYGFSRIVSGEQQYVLPSYLPNGIVAFNSAVLALKVGETITGLPGVEWIDLNVVARAWAADPA